MQVAGKLDQLKINSYKKAKTVSLPRLEVETTWGILVACTSTLALIWRLSAITLGKVSASELATKHQLYINSPWWKSFANIYGPYYFLLHLTYAISSNAWSLRLASVLLGVVTVTLVYWIVNQFHGYKIGLLAAGVALFSFGQLAISRNGTPLSVQPLMLVALLSAIIYLSRRTDIIGFSLMLVLAMLGLYIPGGIWLSLTALALSWPDLKESFTGINVRSRIIAGVGGIILMAPLLFRLVVHYSQSQIYIWLGYGLKGNALHVIHSFGNNILSTPLDLFLRNMNLNSNLSLGHLPAMPFAFTILSLLGLFSYATRFKNWRFRAIILLMVICWAMSGFNLINPLALLPLFAISAGTGMAYMLKQWYVVFPRNKIAKNFGPILMSLVIIFISFYSFRSYIVAWANNPITKTTYSKKLN